MMSLLFLLLTFQSYTQDLNVTKIEPPNWWSNMKYDEVQFMLSGKNLNNLGSFIKSCKINLLGKSLTFVLNTDFNLSCEKYSVNLL